MQGKKNVIFNQIVHTYFTVPARDSCALFPGLNCSYGCKLAAHDVHSGTCFCETGYELAGDDKTCKGIII
jgi:hypothetical protein